MENIKRTKKEKAQFLQEVTIKKGNSSITIDARDRERVDYEAKRVVGSEPKTFMMGK